jgi:hypothetical protein
MSIADVIRRLQEDRRIAERERLQAQIAAAFAPIRTIERRRYAKPGEINPESLGRRKDDKPVEVVPKTPKRLVPLAKQAAPLLDQIKATGMPHRRHQGPCWDIGDVPEVSPEDVPKLLMACEIALGFAPPEDGLKCNKTDAETSNWTRPLRIGKGK